MADESTQGISNKWLFLTALLLGFVVVFVYNVHIQAIKKDFEGKKVELIKVIKPLAPGEKITAAHITSEEVPQASKDALGDVFLWSEKNTILAHKGRPVNQHVSSGIFLQYHHVYSTGVNVPAERIGKDPNMVGVSIEFDDSESPGDLLSIGDTINLEGVFSIDGGPYQTYPVLDAVQVLSIGRRSATTGREAGRGSKNYRQLGIKLSREEHRKLNNLKTHLRGGFIIQVRGHGAAIPGRAGEIYSNLRPLTREARIIEKRSYAPTAPALTP